MSDFRKCEVPGCERAGEELYIGHEGYVTNLVGKYLCMHHYNLQIFREWSEQGSQELKSLNKIGKLLNLEWLG